MKPRDLANVGLKLLGIYWFVQAIFLLARDVMLPFMDFQSAAGLSWKLIATGELLFVAPYIIISYLCVFRTGFVLRLIALDGAAEETEPSKVPQSYGPLAFSLLGAFLAVPAFGHVLSDVIKWLAQWNVTMEHLGLFRRPMLMTVLPDFAGHAAALLIGIALIVGRKRLDPLWKRLRPLAARGEENEG